MIRDMPLTLNIPGTWNVSTPLRTVAFMALTCLMVAASAWDAYLNLKYRVTADKEENPLARAILQRSADDADLLIAIKLFGTAVAVGIVTMIYHRRPRLAIIAVSSIVAIYGGLLCYIRWA